MGSENKVPQITKSHERQVILLPSINHFYPAYHPSFPHTGLMDGWSDKHSLTNMRSHRERERRHKAFTANKCKKKKNYYLR